MSDPSEWERCGPWLAAALDRAGNTHALEDVRAMVEAGEAHFWPGRRCALVTRINEYPRLKALSWWLIGGDDLSEVLAFLPLLERWARELGCRRMEGVGRRGWERVTGFRPLAVFMVRDLT